MKEYPHKQLFLKALCRKPSEHIVPDNLQRRQADFKRGSTAQKSDAQGGRWSAGGYHMPGSNKK